MEKKGEKKEKPGHPKTLRTLSIIAVILVIAIVALAASLYIPSAPGGTGEDGGQSVKYTDAQVEDIVNAEYPILRDGILLRSVSVLATCKALEEEGTGPCMMLNTSGGVGECLDNYNFLMTARDRCGDLAPSADGIADFGLLCPAVNAGSCEGLVGSERALCFFLTEGDIEQCLRISGATREGCTDFLAFYSAVESGDAGLCESIGYFYERAACAAVVGESCSGTIDGVAKDWSYLKLSWESGDAGICAKISHQPMRDMCVRGGASFFEAYEEFG